MSGGYYWALARPVRLDYPNTYYHTQRFNRTHIKLWLKTGVIAPKTTSLLERVFREVGRRLKRIAWGWSDKAVTNLSKMIMIKQYSREKWERYWKEKLGIEGYFDIQIASVELSPCQQF